MPVQYTNHKGKTYYLHRGKTKSGKPAYYFSMKKEGDLLEAMSEGHEIYEEPLRAQVFLQRCGPRSITDCERMLVKTAVRNIESRRRHLIQVRGKITTVHESDQDLDELRESYAGSLISIFPTRLNELLARSLTYTAVMRFGLVDDDHRLFLPERYCFKGSIDDWIGIGEADKLDRLVGKFVNTLERESFFELY